MTFQELGLARGIQRALTLAGYAAPTVVQIQAIPLVLQGKDLIVAAQTGTGKTASFVAPILQLLRPHSRVSNQANALILVPTRELAIQVHQSLNDYGANSQLRSAVVYGGVKINPQMMRLRGGVDVLVATPGRLLDLQRQNAIKFDQLRILVLDEADRMLSLGFADEMAQLLKKFPAKRQTLLFSATLSPPVKKLAKQTLHEPAEITINPQQVAAISIKQWLAPADRERKTALLLALLTQNSWAQALVFVNTRKGADVLAKKLTKGGFTVSVIHGDKSQAVRLRNLNEFKTGNTQILIGTDVAARGLDIGELPVVVNFELPKVAEDYVHRIGRTGRANQTGEAISLVSACEYEKLRNIEQLLQEVIQRDNVAGFEPRVEVPESKGVPAPRKPKKDKKPKKNKKETEATRNSG